MPLVFSQPGKMGCAGFSLLSPLLKTCLQQRQEDGGAETSHHPLANRLSEVTSPNNPGTIQLPSCHISGHVWDHTQGLSPASIESGHPKPWPGEVSATVGETQHLPKGLGRGQPLASVWSLRASHCWIVQRNICRACRNPGSWHVRSHTACQKTSRLSERCSGARRKRQGA